MAYLAVITEVEEALESDALMSEEASVEDQEANELQQFNNAEIQAVVEDGVLPANTPTLATRIWNGVKDLAWDGIKATVVAGIFIGIMKATAAKTSSSGKRVCLSKFLTQVQASFIKQGLNWNDIVKNSAAQSALLAPTLYDATC